MSEDNTAVQMAPPIQGGEERVSRQSGLDLKMQELKNDPMYNMPVIQGSADIFTTRQSGITLVPGDGGLQADHPASPQHLVADRAISIDHEAGMPGHPGVVPGNPDMHGDKALPAGHVYQGGPEVATRQAGPPLDKAAVKALAEAAGFIVSDRPIAPDKDAGMPGHPGVVPGNTEAMKQAAAGPSGPIVQGGAEEVQRNAGDHVFHADTGQVDDRIPSDGPQVLGAGELPVIKKAPIVPVIISDRPAPPGTVSVHDPMEVMREQAAASTAMHPLNPNPGTLPVVEDRKPVKKAAGKAKGKAKASGKAKGKGKAKAAAKAETPAAAEAPAAPPVPVVEEPSA